MHQIKKTLDSISSLYLLAITLLVLLQGLIDDKVLFHSDLVSYLLFTLSLSLVLFVGVLLIAAIISLVLFKHHRELGKWLRLTIATLFLSGFVIYSFEAFILKISSLHLFIIFALVVFVLISFMIVKMGRLDEVSARTAQLARLVTSIAASLFLMLFAYTRLGTAIHLASSNVEPKHAILLVIDRYPVEYLHSYNTEKPVTGFDLIASDKGLLFTNARTNAVWTNGFFGVLYTGHKKQAFHAGDPKERVHNLISLLHAHDVSTRWITFHANGAPEGNRISNYSGLRSIYLSEHLAWLPALLGLDYNVFTFKKSGRGFPPSERQDFVNMILNHFFHPKDLFTNYLINEVEQLQIGSKRSCLIFHIDFALDLPTPFEEYEKQVGFEDVPHEKLSETRFRMRQKSYEGQAKRLGQRLEKFLDQLKTAGLLKNTMVIITADHGMVLKRERRGYQIHPDEAAMRVPLLVVNSGRTGIDDRLFETIDITQTLLQYFDVDETLNQRAISFFDKENKKYISTATYFQNDKKIWYFILYINDLKYRFNMHRKGQGESVLTRVDNLNEVLIEKGERVRNAVAAELAEALAEYNLDGGSVHQLFNSNMLLKKVSMNNSSSF